MEQNSYERPIDAVSTKQSVDETLRETFLIALKGLSGLDPQEKEWCIEKVRDARDAVRSAIEGDDRFLASEAVRVISHLASADNYSLEEPGKNEFSSLGLSFFQEFQEDIEKILEKGWVKAEDVLDSYYRMADIGDTVQSIAGLTGLVQHFDLIRKGFSEKREHFKEIRYLRKILQLGSHEKAQNAVNCLLDIANTKIDEEEFPALISMLCGNSEYKSEGITPIKHFLEKHNLPFAEIYSAWQESFTHGNVKNSDDPSLPEPFGQSIYSNIRNIQILEKANRGICRFLWDEFQIADFGRYPPELLLKQRENFRSLENPYGLVIFPRNDWNGSFYSDKAALEGMFAQLKGEFDIRVFECEGKVDVVRALRKCDDMYNPPNGGGHKISLLILGGHGTENSVRFGGNDKRHVLYTEDLARKVSGKAGGYLDENPTIILASCSTGAEGGIAQELSKRFGAKVVAPQKPSSIVDLHASKNRGGKFRFNASYTEKGVKNVYMQGAPVKK